jgi:hypothetical protein
MWIVEKRRRKGKFCPNFFLGEKAFYVVFVFKNILFSPKWLPLTFMGRESDVFIDKF